MKSPSQTRGPRKSLITFLCLATFAGCDGLMPQKPVTETPRQAGDLLAAIQERVSSAWVTNEAIASQPRSFRLTVLQKTVREGLDAIRQLDTASDATPPQRAEARRAESQLLYLGAKHGDESYVDALSQCAERLLTEDPASPECQNAVYYWLRYKYVDGQQPADETLATLSEFAEAFPQGEHTASLLSTAAIRLSQDGQLKSAAQLLAVADRHCGDSDELRTARNKLQGIQAAGLARARQEQFAARLRHQVLSATRGVRLGYFVVESEELRPKSKKYVRYDYSVRNGFDGVLEYAQTAESKGWSWKVVANYPDDTQGFRDAHNKVALMQRSTPSVLVWNQD